MNPGLTKGSVVTKLSQNLNSKEQLIQVQPAGGCDAGGKKNIQNICMLGLFSVSLNYITYAYASSTRSHTKKKN